MEGKTVLITGGTGSLGRALAEELIKTNVKKVIIFSRGEYAQVKMEREIGSEKLRFFIGDVRDKDRLYRAFNKVDIVIHSAALKHIHKVELNSFEGVLTNVFGSKNVIDIAIDRKVKKVLMISTDKAVDPATLYGATKLCAEKLFIDGRYYAGSGNTRFSVIRFGNFINSSGSIFEYFKDLRDKGCNTLPITDFKMRRYFISFQDAVKRIVEVLNIMRGGEVYIPIMREDLIVDIAQRINPLATLSEIGKRPGEKIRELLYSETEEISRIKNFIVVDNKGR